MRNSQCNCLNGMNKIYKGNSDIKSLSKISFGIRTVFVCFCLFFQLVDQNANVLQSIYVASVLFISIFIPTRTGESLRNRRRLHWESVMELPQCHGVQSCAPFPTRRLARTSGNSEGDSVVATVGRI